MYAPRDALIGQRHSVPTIDKKYGAAQTELEAKRKQYSKADEEVNETWTDYARPRR